MADKADPISKRSETDHKNPSPEGHIAFTPQTSLGVLIQRAQKTPALLTSSDILRLQRAIGNQALVRYMTPVTTVQRTLWEADDTLVWKQVDATETTVTPPTKPPTSAGQVYDDETGTLYANWDEYPGDENEMEMDEDEEMVGAVLSTTDLPEDDDEDLNYEFEEGQEESDDEDEEVANTNAPPTADTDPEMTLDDYNKTRAQALTAPVTSSTLKDRSGKYPTKTLTSNVKFKRKGETTIQQRSAGSGPVTIVLETVELWVNDKQQEFVRPISIEGIVEPTVTTGRDGAPDPLSGTQIYKSKEFDKQLTGSIQAPRNMGMTDAERGHIMALELGGPDIPENIVPQWAKFQGTGDWRKMEVKVLELAQEAGKKNELVRYKVTVFYKETGSITPTIKSFGVPAGFRSTVQYCDLKHNAKGSETEVFNQGQAQDITDTMLAERVLATVEGSDWDKTLDSGKPKKARENVKKTTKTKKESGQKKREAAKEVSKKKKAAVVKKKRDNP